MYRTSAGAYGAWSTESPSRPARPPSQTSMLPSLGGRSPSMERVVDAPPGGSVAIARGGPSPTPTKASLDRSVGIGTGLSRPTVAPRTGSFQLTPLETVATSTAAPSQVKSPRALAINLGNGVAQLQPTFGLYVADSMRGCVVSYVMSGSPAAIAGFVKDDVLLTMDGKEVTDKNRFRDLLAASASQGPTCAIVISRIFRGAGKELSIVLPLNEGRGVGAGVGPAPLRSAPNQRGAALLTRPQQLAPLGSVGGGRAPVIDAAKDKRVWAVPAEFATPAPTPLRGDDSAVDNSTATQDADDVSSPRARKPKRHVIPAQVPPLKLYKLAEKSNPRYRGR